MPTYDPLKVTLSFAKATITGYGAGTFIKASYNEDLYSLTIGADGAGARVRNANQSGKVEFTLLASSPSNDVLMAVAALDRSLGQGIAPLLCKDGNGAALAQAQNAWIVKPPDLERGKELGEVTWTLETDNLQLVQGGMILP